MFILLCWLLSAIVGAIIGNMKGRPTAGAFWGLLLGPLGWLVMVSVLSKRPKCPECFGVVVIGAHKCRHCGSVLEQAVEAPPIPSRWATLVLNRTWCDCIAVLVVGLLIGWRWQAIRKSHDADSEIQDVASQSANGVWEGDGTQDGVLSKDRFGMVAARLGTRDPPEPITKFDFFRAELGMAYGDVCEIFKCCGEEIAQAELRGKSGPIETMTCVWTNKDGSSVTGIFRNLRLIQKSQVGLQ